MQPDRRTEHARRIAAMRREMDERERTLDRSNPRAEVTITPTEEQP